MTAGEILSAMEWLMLDLDIFLQVKVTLGSHSPTPKEKILTGVWKGED